MKKNRVRLFSICIILVFLLTSFVACKGSDSEKDPTDDTTTTVSSDTKNYWEMYGEVDDSSELPTWTGDQLKLVQWLGHGTGLPEHLKAENDVVTPEVKRVTGVELDADKSYDNETKTIDVKLSLMAAAGNYPDIINTTSTAQLQDLVKAGKLYDLTELLPQYAPDLMKDYDATKYTRILENVSANLMDGKYYFAPLGIHREMTYDKYKDDPNFNKENYSRIYPPQPVSDWTHIWVRDDLLKKLYPTAKSMDEIEALYMQNGKFTKEDIFDVPINSTADFTKLMKDLKALIDKEGIKENNKPVEVTYAFNGGDNWPVVTCFLPQINGIPTMVDYFTYYDKKSSKIEYSIKSDWFKNMVHDYQKLVAEGVVSKASLVDNNTIFTEKLNSGHYAITFAWLKPDENALKAAGKTYRYRPIYPNINYDFERFAWLAGPHSNSNNIGIFKDSVEEKDVPQILRYLNYFATDIGQKVTYWGPKDAGLFIEQDGIRMYKDKDLEEAMVYGKQNKANVKYNLYAYNAGGDQYRCAWPPYPFSYYAGLQHPQYTYPTVAKQPSSAETYFQPGMLPGLSREEHFVYVGKGDFLPDYGDQWNAFSPSRDAFEKALTTVFAAKDDAGFEKNYAALLSTAEQLGLNDKTLADINAIFEQKSPNAKEDAAKIN